MVDVQTANLPPGLNTRKISLKAFSFDGTRQKAPLEIMTSIIPSGRGIDSMSAFTNLMPRPLVSALAYACFTSFAEISSPITLPDGPA